MNYGFTVHARPNSCQNQNFFNGFQYFSIKLYFNLRTVQAINLVYEVLSALDGEEVQNFLPVFSEVIIWGATDEGLDSLIEKMTNKD